MIKHKIIEANLTPKKQRLVLRCSYNTKENKLFIRAGYFMFGKKRIVIKEFLISQLAPEQISGFIKEDLCPGIGNHLKNIKKE